MDAEGMKKYEEAVRDVIGMHAIVLGRGGAGYVEFDAWLAAHDAEVQAQVVAEEPEERWQYGAQNPDDADGKIIAWSRGFTKRLVEQQGHRLFRRTPGVPAGPWVPVKQEGAETDA